MNKKTQILIIFLLLVVAFLAGSTFAKLKIFGSDNPLSKTAQNSPTGQVAAPTSPPFQPQKSDKPEVKFFVMSFCPFGNQAEAGFEPVYQLLKDKVSWQPRYIVSQITAENVTQCKDSCPQRVGNTEAKTKCEDAIKAGQVTGMDADACVKQYFPYKSTEDCIVKTCNTLKVGSWESLHGPQELNQDVREICALKQGSLDKWWNFVSLVNKNCTAQNADSCWTAQAQSAELNTANISSCEKQQVKSLLENEVAESTKYQAQGSPTVLINDTLYSGGRSPEDYKKAICSAFKNAPEECNKVLGQESAATSGGCGN